MSENSSFSRSIKDILDGISKENEKNKSSAQSNEEKESALVFDDTPVTEKEAIPKIEFEVVPAKAPA